MKKFIIFFSLVFWPLSFSLNNKPLKLPFPPETIFIVDYQAQQKVLRDTKLYKTVFMARAFHNKGRIIIDKFTNNFFALTDPNNYFFGFAPRQIVENQNLQKYPFVSLPFFAWGVWKLKAHKRKGLIIFSFIVLVLGLSLLANFDKYDLLLWFPISAVVIHGVNLWPKQYRIYTWIFLFFVIPELIRLFL